MELLPITYTQPGQSPAVFPARRRTYV
jgi:hypothetical protein